MLLILTSFIKNFEQLELNVVSYWIIGITVTTVFILLCSTQICTRIILTIVIHFRYVETLGQFEIVSWFKLRSGMKSIQLWCVENRVSIQIKIMRRQSCLILNLKLCVDNRVPIKISLTYSIIICKKHYTIVCRRSLIHLMYCRDGYKMMKRYVTNIT